MKAAIYGHSQSFYAFESVVILFTDLYYNCQEDQIYRCTTLLFSNIFTDHDFHSQHFSFPIFKDHDFEIGLFDIFTA